MSPLYTKLSRWLLFMVLPKNAMEGVIQVILPLFFTKNNVYSGLHIEKKYQSVTTLYQKVIWKYAELWKKVTTYTFLITKDIKDAILPLLCEKIHSGLHIDKKYQSATILYQKVIWKYSANYYSFITGRAWIRNLKLRVPLVT